MAHGIGLSAAHNYFVPVFLPTDISNLVLHLGYKSGYIAVDDDTIEDDAIDDGDSIKQWSDKTSNENHAVQSNNADRPKYNSDTGYKSIIFKNNAEFFDLTSAITISANTDFTVAVRIAFANINTDSVFGSSSTNFLSIIDNNSFTILINDSTVNNFDHSSETIKLNRDYIIVVTRTGGSLGSLSIYVKDVKVGTGGLAEVNWGVESALPGDPQEFVIDNIGCDADDTNPLNANMKDFLVWNGTAANQQERKLLYEYLTSSFNNN